MGSFFQRLGWRYGTGLVALVLVAIVILIARAFPHSSLPSAGGQAVSATGPAISGPAVTGPSTVPGASRPPVPVASSPGFIPLHSPVPPRTPAGKASPAKVATAFAKAWLDHTGPAADTWLRRVSKYTTAAAADRLATADPANVPATRITGTAKVADNTADQCTVSVPTDAGTLILTMALGTPGWQVATIDWTPA